jgi:anaphase-promoting complex subunit 8
MSLQSRSPPSAVYTDALDASYDSLQLARVLFDLKEFVKAASVLTEYAKPEFPAAMFLYHFSLYLYGECRRDEEIGQGTNPAENKNLYTIESQLVPVDALCAYLLGLVYKRRGDLQQAKVFLVQSLNAQPVNWSAWSELSELCDEATLRGIKNHWMKNFFIAQFYHKMQQPEEAIDVLALLAEKCFPSSSFLYASIGNEFYLMDDYSNALCWFEQVEAVDPYRYELMDVYSNILYVKEDQGKLSYLAYRLFHNDKYRPETCFVLGNYYSLKNDHSHAMIYFKRATQLDRHFLPAWILMGHEYLELQNITKAIESYRTAIELDGKDYRAWYGLAETYEVSDMNLYAIFYYYKAIMTRPQDSRLWVALGTCYEKMGKRCEATKCYEKAERLKDREGVVLHRLARLYAKLSMTEKAAKGFLESLARKDAENDTGEETVEAILFLKQYYLDKGQTEEAANYARRLYDFGGTELDRATSVIRETERLS